MSSAKKYKLPQGTERHMGEEAFRRQILTQRVQNLFTSWGYLPVQTPVFDFYDLYAPFLGKAAENVYRLVDREGDLLVLRSDITLFLARSMGVTLQEGHAPLRVCYADTILRHQDTEDISANEFFQIGAEFLGSKGPGDDAEILLLLEDILQLLGLDRAKIHLGSRGVFNAAFGQRTPEDRQKLQDSLLVRRWDEFSTLLGKTADREELLSLFQLLSSAVEARLFLQSCKSLKKHSPAVFAEAEALIDLVLELSPLGVEDRFRVDFSEAGRQSYYTGLVFQVYHDSVGDAVAAGGRYDHLLREFGIDTPSVGFSFHLRKVEHLVDLGSLLSPSQAEKAKGSNLAEKWEYARGARKAGRIVTL